MKLTNLFPVPLGTFKYAGDITEEHIKFVNGIEKLKNIGNTGTKDTRILKHEQLKGINKFIEKSVQTYYQDIYAPPPDVELKITQSWVNFTKKGEYHHQHTHPNSFISGVFYLQVDEDKDRIHFYSSRSIALTQLHNTSFNMYNSDYWWVPVKNGELVLFPSNLTHMVNPVESDSVRISLSFNTFTFGNLGHPDMYSELKVRSADD